MRDDLFPFYTSLMLESADEIVIGYASPGKNLERVCGSIGDTKSESLASAPTENPVAKVVSQ